MCLHKKRGLASIIDHAGTLMQRPTCWIVSGSCHNNKLGTHTHTDTHIRTNADIKVSRSVKKEKSDRYIKEREKEYTEVELDKDKRSGGGGWRCAAGVRCEKLMLTNAERQILHIHTSESIQRTCIQTDGSAGSAQMDKQTFG